MAWNSIVKQRLQLQVTNQRGVPPLKTFPVHQHGSSSPNTGAYSNSMLQGRPLRDSRNLSDKNARKSFTAKKALLIACGVQCVLSPRPSNCSTSSPHKDEKDRPHSTSARGQKSSRENRVETEGELKVWDAYTVIKRTEERQRARSSIHRQRVPPDSSQRPSTVPLENQTGRRALSTPETPICKILWRRKDDQNVLQDRPQDFTEDESLNLTPSLHLYLPSSYQLQEQKEDTAPSQENSSEVHEKQDVTEELTMESQKQDITLSKTEGEEQNDFTDGIRCDITDTWQNDIQKDTPENDMTEERPPQDVTDDDRQQETMENQCNIDRSFNIVDDKQEYDIIEKPEVIYRRNRSSYKASDAKLTVKTRYPATATALTFPSTPTHRNPSPTLSLLPSFYGTSFGYRVRTTSEPCRSKTRIRKACNDNRTTQPMTDMRHTIEIKGNPCIIQTRAGVPVSPHPKIMSTERGSQPHKIKTTKTFLWGPEGPQETKTVCELHSQVNRWRSLD
ncbi:Tryptophan 2,3-dioxygenase [Labeo rohita]|uniref:Tryptophan 2,3-dioxygenase n=1 Tax=Labeo rohita TaxID=84645 RepID=A0ABQ8MFD7_LABRO|nr:Tryptophan 2,3-dioxygenase [Labeo rohita]